jgi:hydrogenase-4 membrane subunit HyfE
MAVIFAWIAVGALVVTSVGLLLTRDWRWSISLLAVQYLAMLSLSFTLGTAGGCAH